MKWMIKNVLFFFGISLLVFTGCAHQNANSTLQNDEAYPSQLTDETVSYESDEDAGNNEDENSLDEFEEEFEEKSVQVADPLFPLNYVMYHFNDKLYFWVLKPVAKGYKFIVPDIARTGIKNFFHNLETPIRLTSCLLQGKGSDAGNELLGFFINSTVGVLGFGDPAQNSFNLQLSDEDLGQTFGSWGIGNGIYMVWPFFGPSTLRDTFGMAGDSLLDPLNYLSDPSIGYGASFLETVNETSFKIGDYEAIKDAAIKPYEAFRNAYIQYRKAKVMK